MREGQGFLTIACNNDSINYLAHACLLAESIKDTQKNNRVSLIANQRALDLMEDKHRKIFDKVIAVAFDEAGKNFTMEAKAWALTPYKQTIKIESDMLMTSSIDHWWDLLDQKDIVFTRNVFQPTGQLITNRSQRKLFDDNDLPDIYTGLYYFRYSRESQQFFTLVNSIYDNWDWFKDNLKNCRLEQPVTDEVFAIAAKIWGVEKCTLSGSVPSFVHMKNPLIDIPNDAPWWRYMYWEKDRSNIKLAFHQQHLPIHYHDKNILERYYDR